MFGVLTSKSAGRASEGRIGTKIAVVGNTAWYLANFRLSLARALMAAGYDVIAVAPPDEDVARILAAGVRFSPLSMDNKGTNPANDLGYFFRLFGLLRRERPMAFLGYTVKPNVYGGLAAQLLGIPSIHNIAGLGTGFIQNSWVTWVIRLLYRLGLRKAVMVFFQNNEDLKLFLEYGLVDRQRVERLPGSGVDVDKFFPIWRMDQGKQPFCFLLFGRLLWDKGVGEFVEAARKLRSQDAGAEFQMLGFLSVENRSAISRAEVNAWEEEGLIRYLGVVEDVRPFIAQADCVVLPSFYREGVPRSLLEAASMGKPIITTDAVGCREAIEDGVTGYFCKPRDAADLADKMARMMALSSEERAAMGQRGREKMIREFEERKIIDRYLAVVKEITQGS